MARRLITNTGSEPMTVTHGGGFRTTLIPGESGEFEIDESGDQPPTPDAEPGYVSPSERIRAKLLRPG